MNRHNESSSIEVCTSTLDVDALLVSFGNDTAFKDELGTADVLIVPTDLSPEYESPVFPDTTREVFRLLSVELEGRAIINAAVKDEDYIEFEYRSEQIILPVLFVTGQALLSVVTGIIGNYLYNRLKRSDDENAEGTVKCELHFKAKDGAQLMYKYEGPVETFQQETLQQLRGFVSQSEEKEDARVSEEDDTPRSD